MSILMRRDLTEKTELHPRNKHRHRYNFKELSDINPELLKFVKLNEYGYESIDFANANAVLELNKSLLKYFYKIDNWNIPEGYLCPPIPGRADYIHYAADILASGNAGVIPTGNKINVLDIGVGSNCIFPLIGNREYGWKFVGVDISKIALESANRIIDENLGLSNEIELRFQKNKNHIFRDVVHVEDHFDLCICNPPFHSSIEEASIVANKKVNNLTKTKIKNSNVQLNFGGQANELYCNGGEIKFIINMARESKIYFQQFLWFTTLVSKQSNVKTVNNVLKELDAFEIRTIEMRQGNKISRIVSWTYLSIESQHSWLKNYWQKSKI